MKTEEHCLYIDGERISINIREGNGGDVILIHGLGCSKESFNDIFEGEWFKGRRLIAPDLLGFGDSSKPEEYSYTMEQHANCLNSLLSKLNVINPIIIAHSMGGAIALLLIDKLSSIEYFFCLEGNLIDEDCTISKTVASQSENAFIVNSYELNPVKYRCRQRDTEPESSPIGYYRSSLSLVQMSESGVLLMKFNKLTFPKAYIYGYENRNTKVVKLLSGHDIIEIEECGHFMLNDNPISTYSAIEGRLSG